MFPGRRRLVPVLDLAIAAALALAALAALTGGLRLDLGPLDLSLRTITRPLLAAALLAALRVRATRAFSASASAPPPSGDDARLATPTLRIALLAITFTAIGCWPVFLTTVCGGSDSYGYVSASRLLLSGSLVQPQNVAGWLPVPNAIDLATPAGYVPSPDRSAIVPQYPLGLPALMAALTLVFGAVGPYLAAPLSGVALVILSARAGAEWAGAAAGLAAAALVAWNPLVMAYATQPMSDVPAAMWFMAAVWCLARRNPASDGGIPAPAVPRAPAWAGLFAGLSFATRPGGVGAIAALAVMAAAAREGRWRTLSRFALGCTPLVIAQAALQWYLFGSPLQSGYGSLGSLFAGDSALDNASIYARAFLTVHTPWWFAALGAAAAAPRRQALAWGLAALALGGAPYLLYFRFDHWESLRFMLPAVVLLSMAAATGLTWAAGAMRGRAAMLAPAIVAAGALAFAAHSFTFLDREGTLRLMDRESRYPDTAARVSQLTPASAIVFAAQHSGSLRHYANRMTLRWDFLRPEDFAPVLEALAARQLAAFVVLEGNEQMRFRERFAAPLARVSMLPVAQIRDVQVWELR